MEDTTTTPPASAKDEIAEGERFGFGANWRAFLDHLDDERIDEACKSIREMLEVDSLVGKRFVDAGCGSGLFSLAARKLGAEIVSFDFDPDSVECATILRERYFPDDEKTGAWKITQGSVLDPEFLNSLGKFDVMYSWGVLHHTGSMWDALENVVCFTEAGSCLVIAIYSDQGGRSRFWSKVKKFYCRNGLSRFLVKSVFYPYFAFRMMIAGIVDSRNPFALFSSYKKSRGMSVVHDWDDWLGGYPFEVAKPDELLSFYRKHGFELIRLVSNWGGCNELVFRKKGNDSTVSK